MGVTDDTTDDHGGHGGHHLPAVEDWPQGFGEASWWPFITAVAATGLYVGAGLWIMSRGDDPLVPGVVGPVVFVASVGVFLAGLFGWLYHAFIVGYWERGTDPYSGVPLRFAMLLFLGTEIATFGAGFTYYFFVRAGEWPQLVDPAAMPALLNWVVVGNTLVLLTSSVTVHYAHVSLLRGNRGRFVQLIGATLLLGVLFLSGWAYEYYEFITHEGFTITEGALGSAFYGLTGLHGLHVSMGIVMLGVVLARALNGHYSSERHTSVSTVSMYWHFVDAVWVFLVAVLYVGSGL